jgi:hypothetical protein
LGEEKLLHAREVLGTLIDMGHEEGAEQAQ